ncbi:MAG: 50S ribosomal protein L6 [Fibrobacterota bacterium]
MSRIGKMPVEIPPKVKVALNGRTVMVEGPKGKLSQEIRPEISVAITDKAVSFSRGSEAKNVMALHGLYRALVHNMVVGVSQGFEKTLDIQGVGYKALMKGKDLELALGYSHPIVVKAPAGITFACEGQTRIKVSGPDKTLVGQIANNLRMLKPPEPYKGKGVRYLNEQVRKKAGKTNAA